MYAIRTHPTTLAFQPWHPADLGEVAAFIETQHERALDERGWLQLAIVEKTTGLYIGDVGIHVQSDTAQVELGITIAPAMRRNGFGTEALLAVMAYLFEEVGVHRIIGVADNRNTASLAMLQRCGLRQEAVLRESGQRCGVWSDEVVFAILREEWRR